MDLQLAHNLRSHIHSIAMALAILEHSATVDQKRPLAIVRNSLNALSDQIDASTGTVRQAPPDEPAKNIRPGTRVLLVEDEYLLARTMADELTRSGCEVVGPTGSMDDAVELARFDAPDCAVVDANLHGELSLPVIDVLTERGIPFVVVTGYDSRALPPAFGERPFLQKPVGLPLLLKSIAAVTG